MAMALSTLRDLFKLKALLDARVGLHEPRVRLAQNLLTTSPTRLKQRVAIILTLYGPNSFFRRFSGHNLR